MEKRIISFGSKLRRLKGPNSVRITTTDPVYLVNVEPYELIRFIGRILVQNLAKMAP